MNHKIADVVEKINIPGNLMRDLATINNPVVSFPKKVGSFLYINTNVPRQWFIQPQQMAELVAIHPSTARQTFSDMTRMSMHLVGSIEGAGTMGKLAKWSSEHMNIKAISTPESEIRMNVQAIRDSGIIDSVDTNVLVHGVFHDTNKLVTGVGEKVRKTAVAPFSTASKLGRGLGYDPAEILNKMGIWLQMKQKYITQNPQKKWNSPAGREWIANAVHLYSGNMNKAGNLPYQAGMLSPFFQFSAIGHKQFMNFMQNTATPLSGAERARLGAVRFALFGAKYGLPGGGLIYMYIDKYGDEETAKKADLIKHGIADILVNKAMRTFMDEDGEYTDLGVSRSISPLGESGVPYFDQAFQTIAMLDDDSATNPRFPLFGVATNLLKVHKQWESIWYGKDYSTKEKLEYAALTAMSAASGFNNYFKAMIILGSGEKLNRLGNPIGLKFTTAEAIGLFIGVQSNKEEWAYEQMRRFRDDTENRKQIAKDIYQYTTQIENMVNPDGTASDKMEAVGNALDIAVNGEGFTAAAKQDVLTQVLRLSARDGNLKTNIIKNWVMSGKMLSDNEKSKMLDILRRDKSPEIQELVTAIEEDNL